MKIEVCVDNIESVITANSAGANRIELCGSLALGGVTPPYSLIKHAIELSEIPIYVMIRPRAGDFIFNEHEVKMMLEDIKICKELGANGVVIGALTVNAEIDLEITKQLVEAAKPMGVSFHRAFDLVKDPKAALDQLISLGVERILTSGCAASAFQGRELIKELVEIAKDKLIIMAGAGVNVNNALELTQSTGIKEIHLSAKSTRNTKMDYSHVKAAMGANPADDGIVNITSHEIVAKIKSIFEQAGL